MASCARCGLPVAMARASCVYCGAALPDAALREFDAPAAKATPAQAEPALPAGEERVLLVALLEGADPERLAGELGWALAEASHRVRRGGPELLQVRAAAGAERECERLAACGAQVQAIPESAARLAARPWRAQGGRRDPDATLRLRGAEGDLSLSAGELLLVVHGRIQREYQPRGTGKRLRTASLEQGHRIHLHLRGQSRPLELDPGGFEFDAESAPGSSLLRLRAWVAQLAPEAPVDDRFRLLPPALGPEEPESGGAVAASAGLRRRGGGGETPVLDNLRQFRFYSAWRGAWERALSG